MNAMTGVAVRLELGIRRLVATVAAERGQGTVEYVGLVLLVAVLMGGMVAAVGGLNSLPGKELAQAITKKIVEAVQKVAFAK